MATTTTTTTTAAPSVLYITGDSKSRLSDLKKYSLSGDFFNQYSGSTGAAKDGVNQSLSNLNVNPQVVVYYVGGITYTDYIYGDPILNRTTFKFVGQGYSSPDFIDEPLVKHPDKTNIVQNPKVYNDVFIVRQEASAFDKNYKLKNVKSLVALKTYASGRYFNVVSNT